MHFWGMFEQDFFTLFFFVPSSHFHDSLLTSSLSSLYPFPFLQSFALFLLVDYELLPSFSSPPCWVPIQSCMCTIQTLALEPSAYGTCECVVSETMGWQGLRWLSWIALGMI
ncbi:hypothetical protein AMTRI_Chr13g116000 [Amborella trichopoda]